MLVLALGTNGPIDRDVLEQIRNIIGPSGRWSWSTCRRRASWTDGVNTTLSAFALVLPQRRAGELARHHPAVAQRAGRRPDPFRPGGRRHLQRRPSATPCSASRNCRRCATNAPTSHCRSRSDTPLARPSQALVAAVTVCDTRDYNRGVPDPHDKEVVCLTLPPSRASTRRWRSLRDFRELQRRHRSFVFPLAVLFLIWYFVYVLLAAYAHDFMATPVFGSVNVGLLFGLGQFVTTFVITMAYVRYANRKLDPLRREAARRELEGACAK